jgi:hypothetical protein
MDAQDDENQLGNRSWLLLRPPNITMSLPLEFRWEFTRRHPYYLQFWQLAKRHHEKSSQDSEQRAREQAAIFILSGIGMAASMVPPDPQFGPEAVGHGDLGAVWRGGAVAPATFRTLAHMLLAALPGAQRSQLGRLLNESAEFDSANSGAMFDVHQRLANMGDIVWDSFPQVPVVSLNLEMPQRAITEAIENLVREWKEDRSIPEQRRRDDKLTAYLTVWDAREGWTNGEYAGPREQTFRQIAAATREPLSTVISRYRTAFRYLSGHNYSPELWIRLMGPLKLSRFVEGEGLAMRRPWRSPNLRPVTETVLLPGRREFERPEFLQIAGVTSSAIASIDLAMDIQTLIAQDRTDDEIVEHLEIRLPGANDLVAELRRRHKSE